MSVDDGPRTTRPALDVLDRDQNAILYGGDQLRDPPIRPLIRGFTSYWQLCCWWQAAAVRTLGHVRKVVPADSIGPFSSFSSRLLVHDNEPADQYVRQRTVERLDDACTLAYRQFRQRAVERAGEDADRDGDGDVVHYERVRPADEANPLMRPAFDKLDRQQAGALRDLWTGFADRPALSEWVRNLTAPTHGETPDGLLDEIVADKELLRALLDQQTERATLQRYQFAAHVVLPAFARAAATLRGGEQHETTDDTGGWKHA